MENTRLNREKFADVTIQGQVGVVDRPRRGYAECVRARLQEYEARRFDPFAVAIPARCNSIDDNVGP